MPRQGNFPEVLSQRILVGITLLGRLGVPDKRRTRFADATHHFGSQECRSQDLVRRLRGPRHPPIVGNGRKVFGGWMAPSILSWSVDAKVFGGWAPRDAPLTIRTWCGAHRSVGQESYPDLHDSFLT